MTLDELIAWVSGQAARWARDAYYADDDEWTREDRERVAILTSVENALIRLREIGRAHGGEA